MALERTRPAGRERGFWRNHGAGDGRARQASARVLAIGLDAAEPSLIERWIADGTLPHLRRLRRAGSYRRLASGAEWLSGSPWPTFNTGRRPQDHGIYHHLQWRPELMSALRPAPDWLPAAPFWRELGAPDKTVIALDMPMGYAPEPFAGPGDLGLDQP